MRTQLAIIGGGPAGLLLSQLLNRAVISTIVLERKSRDYMLSPIRAGVLEWGTVELIHNAGAGARMDLLSLQRRKDVPGRFSRGLWQAGDGL